MYRFLKSNAPLQVRNDEAYRANCNLWRGNPRNPKAQLAREFNISRETLYQYLRTDD